MDNSKFRVGLFFNVFTYLRLSLSSNLSSSLTIFVVGTEIALKNLASSFVMLDKGIKATSSNSFPINLINLNSCRLKL